MEKGAPNFIQLAEAFGIKGILIKDRTDLTDSIKMIMEYDGPIVVDFQVIPDSNCYPMVAPGKSNAQMIGV
jgi:acetolactate synthase-1/2/3 large subunit